MIPGVLRLVAWAVPAEWRVTVLADLMDERARQGHSQAWLALEVLRVGCRLRLANGTGALGEVWAVARHGWTTDIRLAWRSGVRQPGTSLAVVLMLGLGVGAVTAIFAVFNQVVFRPVPGVRDVGSLVSVYIRQVDHPLGMASAPFDRLVAMRTQSPALVGLADGSDDDLRVTTTAGGTPTTVLGAEVTRDFFQTLGVRARLGRLFASDEYEAPDTRLAVISEHFWATRFGHEARVVGQPIWINEQRFVVLGVADTYTGNSLTAEGMELWLPYGARRLLEPADVYEGDVFKMVGRLAPGATLDVAQAQLRQAFLSLGPYTLGRDTRYLPLVFPGLSDGIGVMRARLLQIYGVLAVGIGMLLALACANAANLMVARNVRRARDLALRGAIGASRVRLFRELLVEAVGLATASGLLGLGVAILCTRAFKGDHLLAYLPALGAIAIDWRVAVTALGSAASTVFVFALLPAWSASGIDARTALAQTGPTTRRGTAIRTSLVVLQIALALTLIVSTALLGQTLVHLEAMDLGFDPRELYSVALHPAGTSAQAAATLERVSDAVAAANLGSVGRLQFAPLDSLQMVRLRRPDQDRTDSVVVGGYLAAGQAMQALAVPIIAGRALTPADDHPGGWSAGGAMVIGDRLARRLFGSAGKALGRQVVSDYARDKTSPALDVVGVSADLTSHDLRSGPGLTAFLPLPPEGLRVSVLVIRSARPAADVTQVVRQVAHAVDPTLAVPPVLPALERRDDLLSEERVLARLGVVLAGLAALLALAGVNAVVTFVVAERTREYGIRLAIGASVHHIVRQILASVVSSTLAGLAVGVGLVALSAHALTSWLFGVGTFDPATLGWATTALVVSALGAAAWPTRRALKIDPTVALRAE